MDKVKLTICAGTTCFVMGASDIFLIEEELSPDLKERVIIDGATCLGNCKNPECGKAPFVKINDEIIPNASMLSVKERIEELLK